MNRDEKIAFNRKYVKQVIKNSGLTTKQFAETHGFSENAIEHLRINPYLPDRRRESQLREVFPLLMYRGTSDFTPANMLDGNFLRKARLEKGYTAEELATLVGCHPSYILQNELKSNPRTSRIFEKVADILGIPYDALPSGHLLEEDVWYILESDSPSKEVAYELGVNVSTVNNIRRGAHHKKIYAEYKKSKG